MKERKINILREKIYKKDRTTKEIVLIKTNVNFYVKPFRERLYLDKLEKINNCGSLYEETAIDSFSEVIKGMGKKYEVTLTSKTPEHKERNEKIEIFSFKELQKIKSELEKKLKRHTFWIE